MTFKKKHETLSYHLNSEEIINFTIINVILKKQKQLILQKIRLANFNLLKSPFLTQSAQLSSKMNTDDLSISVLCSFFFFFLLQSYFCESSQDSWHPEVNSQLPWAWEIRLYGHLLTTSKHPSITVLLAFLRRSTKMKQNVWIWAVPCFTFASL